MVVEALICAAIVQRTAGLDVGARLYVVEDGIELILHVFPAAVDGGLNAGIGFFYMPGQTEQRLGVTALAKEEEAGNAEIVGDEFIDNLRGQLLSYVVAEERGVASRAITPAVGDFNCQGNAVGYFLDDGVRQGGYVFKHSPAPWERRSACRLRSGGARRMRRRASGNRSHGSDSQGFRCRT